MLKCFKDRISLFYCFR